MFSSAFELCHSARTGAARGSEGSKKPTYKMEGTNMSKKSGFTLIELMIVVAIIAVIAAIAIPNLLRSRISANESAAIGACRTLTTAQTQYHSATGGYAGAIADLYNAGDPAQQYIDATLATGTKQGYTFAVTSADTLVEWDGTAAPLKAGKSGVRTFLVDESGIITSGGDPI